MAFCLGKNPFSYRHAEPITHYMVSFIVLYLELIFAKNSTFRVVVHTNGRLLAVGRIKSINFGPTL